jgi:hypothetical protein
MRKTFIISLTVTAMLAPLAFTHAASAAPTKFKNCAQLNAKYPNGIAGNAAAAKQAVTNGNMKPKVSKAIYMANANKLDRDKNGVACEQVATVEIKTVEIKTEWGFLRIKEVKAPAPGSCTDVPYEMDIRNAANTALGFIIDMKDDFGNMVAEDRPVSLPDGVHQRAMRVCAENWAKPYPSGASIALKAAPKGDYNITINKLTLSGFLRTSAAYSIL